MVVMKYSYHKQVGANLIIHLQHYSLLKQVVHELKRYRNLRVEADVSPSREYSYWFASHGLISMNSHSEQYHQPRDAKNCFELGASTLITN